jgi:peptidoglycan/xylan/chitin deacetylase (PgdA/CDA1 family)
VPKTTRRQWCKLIGLAPLALQLSAQQQNQRPTGKQVVLTFDDAVKSHRSVVAPLLADAGFRATFFITQNWMEDKPNFLTWEEVAEIHKMGFEIGNHTWTHADFSKPENAARLGRELEQVETELERVGVPKPVSFAWCGNGFGPEGIQVLRERHYQFARQAGFEVLFDDRDESPGVKFNDADLIGLPLRITISKRSLEGGGAEVKLRLEKERQIVALAELERLVREKLGE